MIIQSGSGNLTHPKLLLDYPFQSILGIIANMFVNETTVPEYEQSWRSVDLISILSDGIAHYVDPAEDHLAL